MKVTTTTLENDVIQIEFELPEGKTAEELAQITKIKMKQLIKSGIIFGKTVRFYGRMTLGMVAVATHELAHVSKSLEMFDPKENCFYTVVKH